MRNKKPVVLGIVQARLDSSRLPGKVLIPVNGIPLCGYVFSRAKRIDGLTKLALATTDRSIDDPLVEYAQSEGLAIYRGDCNDVALRMLNCARIYQGDYFIRINGDSPFMDPVLISQGITMCQDGRPDLVTNLIPRNFPYGVAVEIINTRSFDEIYKNITQPEDREHITRYFYTHLSEFDVRMIHSNHPELNSARLVVDTPADLETFRTMEHELREKVMLADYVQVASLYLSLNRH